VFLLRNWPSSARNTLLASPALQRSSKALRTRFVRRLQEAGNRRAREALGRRIFSGYRLTEDARPGSVK